MSNQSDYDRRVKDILDRVAKGHLSSDEAATLIAAANKPTAPAPVADETPSASGSTAEGANAAGSGASGAGTPGSGASGSAASGSTAGAASGSGAAGSTGGAGATPEADVPSASVWAEVVDSPDAADTAPAPKHAASGPAASTSGPTGSAPTAGSASNGGPADSAPTAGPAGSAPTAGPADSAPTAGPVGSTPTAGPADSASAGASVPASGVQDSVVDDAPAEEEEVEVEHSNVPVPSGVQRVTIRAVGRRVRLIGEPAISGVAVDGPHVIKRDGNTLAINSEGDMGVSLDGFSMLRNPTDLKAHVNGFAKELSIRVNPMLEVEVEVTGGSVVAERLPGLARVRVTAGTAKVHDIDGPIDMLVQAGSAHLDAQVTKGRSRVRVESGSATVNLRRGSDVRVHTESQLGRVTWVGAVNGQSKDVEIGRGRAALDVEVLVGTAQITSD
jgi:hypothetical protein